MTDEATCDVEIGFRMQTTGKVVVIAEMLESDLAHARHNAHVEHYVDTIGHLNPYFTERRAPSTHEKRNDIQCAAAHGAGIDFRELVIRFGGRHPIIVGSGLFPFRRANKG